MSVVAIGVFLFKHGRGREFIEREKRVREMRKLTRAARARSRRATKEFKRT